MREGSLIFSTCFMGLKKILYWIGLYQSILIFMIFNSRGEVKITKWSQDLSDIQDIHFECKDEREKKDVGSWSLYSSLKDALLLKTMASFYSFCYVTQGLDFFFWFKLYRCTLKVKISILFSCHIWCLVARKEKMWSKWIGKCFYVEITKLRG